MSKQIVIKAKTGQKIVDLHTLLTKADSKELQAKQLALNAVSLGIVSLALVTASHLSTTYGLTLGLIPDSEWVRRPLAALLFYYGMTWSKNLAIIILSNLRPDGIFTSIASHPAHRIKQLYCPDIEISQYHQSLEPLVNRASLLLNILYAVGAFICFVLPILSYCKDEMDRPEWQVDDPLAKNARTCFETSCIDHFQQLGPKCITPCEDTLHYAVGLGYRYLFENQSMIVSYPPHNQVANQAQAKHLIKQFRKIGGFTAVEQLLKIINQNQQRKKSFANTLSTQLIRLYTMPTPKIEVTYAGIMVKLAPRTANENTRYDEFLNGLQAIWQNIFFDWLWKYATTCRGINRFKKQMRIVISKDCSLESIAESSTKENTIFRVYCNLHQPVNIGYSKRLPADLYLIELHRALMTSGFSTYHINNALHFSYEDLSQEDFAELQSNLQQQLHKLHDQHQVCNDLVKKINRTFTVAKSSHFRQTWSYELLSFSRNICLLYLNNFRDAFPNLQILNTYLSALRYFFGDEAKVIEDTDDSSLRVALIPHKYWKTRDLNSFESRMRSAIEDYRQERRNKLPIGSFGLAQKPKNHKRVITRSKKLTEKVAPSITDTLASKSCRSIAFGNGIEYYQTDSDKSADTTCRAYPIQVDWLESGHVFACIPDTVIELALSFTTQKKLIDILRRGRTHGRKALNTGNSAQGIQIENQPYQDVDGHNHTESFGKIKTTDNVGIFGSMCEVTVEGKRYYLVTFDGVPALRH